MVCGEPANTDVGLMAVIAPTVPTVNGNAFEAPNPGICTVTWYAPAVATLAAVSVACTCVGLSRNVVKGLPAR